SGLRHTMSRSPGKPGLVMEAMSRSSNRDRWGGRPQRHQCAMVRVVRTFTNGTWFPSQIRATSMDGGQMISSALAMRDQYKLLTSPVTIIAGAGDRVVFKRMSERFAAAIRHSTLHIIEGAGHDALLRSPRWGSRRHENT
ncbi:MAG TPA: alpha/beta fold hydrolase, partial [Mycobacterium sp.]|nr:alpha/beta fold hydrolase [Mycobacterium sp.]